MAEIAVVLLAAGRGRRFGSGPEDSKLLSLLDGCTLVRRAALAARASRARPLVAVLGHCAGKVRAEIDDCGAAFIINDRIDLGLSRSLQLGLSALPREIDGAVILLADMPWIEAGTIDRLIVAFETAAEPPRAVVPVARGLRGNPVLLGRRLFGEVATVIGDRGARSVLDRQEIGVIEIEIDGDGILIDIDTPRAMAKLARMRPCHPVADEAQDDRY